MSGDEKLPANPDELLDSANEPDDDEFDDGTDDEDDGENDLTEDGEDADASEK
jgi:hypothetical protein